MISLQLKDKVPLVEQEPHLVFWSLIAIFLWWTPMIFSKCWTRRGKYSEAFFLYLFSRRARWVSVSSGICFLRASSLTFISLCFSTIHLARPSSISFIVESLVRSGILSSALPSALTITEPVFLLERITLTGRLWWPDLSE